MMPNQGVYVDYLELQSWSVACFERAGAVPQMAEAMANALLNGDLLGFRTHGVRRLPYNVKQLVTGKIRGQGEPTVLKKKLAVQMWDATELSGLYVVPQAVNCAIDMAKHAGTGTVVVRRAEHVASLATYLEQATSAGMVISLIASTPAQSSVAPFGSSQPLFSPNPFAIGVPTSGSPLLLDMSFSTTAAGKVRQAYEHHELLPWDALVTASGHASRDPKVYFDEPKGAIMPLGGLDLGYKGYGLCLMSEIWTMALSNYGRAQGQHDGECNSVFVQVMDPAAFGEPEQFIAVTDDLLARCKACKPIHPDIPVRIPGENALQLKQQQLEQGVFIDHLTWAKLLSCSERLELTAPLAREAAAN